jgi:UDP-2,3-diacylglucosamine pyrophosphatase LpxH
MLDIGGELMKVYLASDLHLGHENANYPKVMKFLDNVQQDGDQLIILGDLLDLWVSDFVTITSQEPMKSAWEKLIETSKKVPTIVVFGNHDFELSKYTNELAIKDEFEQDNMYFAHGWRWDFEQQIGSPFYGEITDYFHIIYQNYLKTPFQVINSPEQYSDYVEAVSEIANRFAESHNYTWIFWGHTHFPEMKGKLVNCGDFISSGSYIVLEDGNPIVVRM